MIVTFLIACNYLVGTWDYCRTSFRSFFNKRNPCLNLKASSFEIPNVPASAYYDDFSGIKFNPPVYCQRYMTVAQTLEKAKSIFGITKVVDYGCAELAFFPFLKHMEGLEEALFVDVDTDLLVRFSDRVTPLTADYLKPRSVPLKVSVLEGSVADPDVRLKEIQAVVAIELIEHLFPDALEALPYTVFGIVQPKIAIFTTPNSEFNVLFKNFTGFRHDDHKFEWTREQFEDWANNLVDRFPEYTVSFKGIGPGIEGKEHLGCCSQMALFIRSQDCPSNLDESQFKECYKVITDKLYPSKTIHFDRAESILYGANSFIQYASTVDEFYTEDRIEIPISRIVDAVMKFECSEDEVKELLEEQWEVEKLADGKWAVILPYHGLPSGSWNGMSEDDDFEAEAEIASSSPKNEDDFWPEKQDNDAESLWSLNSFEAEAPPAAQEPCPSQATTHVGESTPLIQEPQGAASVASRDEKHQVTRCLSWDHISPRQNKNKNCRYSLNFDKEPVCDINGAKHSYVVQKFTSEEVLDSQSKALDSGYPNSFEQDMDLDLTPEQVDEIITETESSLDGDDESGSLDENHPPAQPPPLLPPQPVHFQENVENGDVANNNRDGEGNNMEAGQDDVLQFEAVIDQQENAVGLEGMREAESDEENHFVSLSEATMEDTVVNSECSNESANGPVGLNSTLGSSSFASCGSGQSGTFDYQRELLELSDLSLASRNSSVTVNFSEDLTEMSEVTYWARYYDGTLGSAFPPWLVNILVDDAEAAAGDMGIPDPEVIAPGLEDVESEIEIVELAEDSSLLMTVNGDLNGGGDFPT